MNIFIGGSKFSIFNFQLKYYYCPLNLEVFAHAYALGKFGLTLERESALLVIFAASKPNR